MKSYQSISSEVYQIDKPIGRSFGDVEYYYNRLAEVKGEILEPAVGTGRILIPLLQKGLRVEGFDLSNDMLAYCRRNLEQASLQTRIFQAAMETFDAGKQYEAIIIPTGTFLLLDTEFKAQQALANFHRHLHPGGCLMFDIFLPANFRKGTSTYRTFTNEDGDLITLQITDSEIDYFEQTTTSHHRYDKWKDGQCVASEFELFSLKWYGIREMHYLLQLAGFQYITISADYEYGDTPTKEDQIITFEAYTRR